MDRWLWAACPIFMLPILLGFRQKIHKNRQNAMPPDRKRIRLRVSRVRIRRKVKICLPDQ